MDASVDAPRRSFAFGLERLGLVGLRAPAVTILLILALSALAVWGVTRLRVDNSLSELFRTDTEEFKRYEEIDRRFPSSEYDVLVVVEGKDLLKKAQLEAFRRAIVDLQLADGVDGLISMLSARGKPDASGYAPPIVPDELPDGPEYDKIIEAMRSNDIVKGKFLSPDGELALAVIALDRKVVQAKGAKEVIGGIAGDLKKELAPVGLKSHLTGAPVMQLEIRNAVERDQLVYNGLGLLFGATIAVIFFKRVSLMLLAALPPVLAVLWSLGLLGWLGFRLNLFLNVMTPLVMVMGFADSMQMVSAIRIRLREGDTKAEAVRFAVRVVGPACVLAHGTALLSFAALLISQSGLIRTFGMAGVLATGISFVAVILVLPLLGLILIRNEGKLAKDRAPADGLMDGLGGLVGWIVDRVVHWPFLTTLVALVSFVVCGWAYLQLEPRYRLADQVPDREQALGATGPHRREADRRQPRPHHDRMEDRRGPVRAAAARGHRQDARGPREAGGPRQRLVAREPAPLAPGGRRRAHRDGAEVRQDPARAPGAPLHRQGGQRRAGDGTVARYRLQPDPAGGREDRPRARRPAQAVPRVHHLRHRPAGDRGAQQRAHDPPAQRGAADLRGLRRPVAGDRLPLGVRRLRQPVAGPVPGGGVGRHHLGQGRRARICFRGGAAGGVRPRHQLAHPFLQSPEPRGAPRAQGRPGDPARPRAGRARPSF